MIFSNHWGANFVVDYAVHPQLRNDRSCLFKLMFEDKKLCRIELLPVSLSLTKTALANEAEFNAICTRMEMLCNELGTHLIRKKDRMKWGKI